MRHFFLAILTCLLSTHCVCAQHLMTKTDGDQTIAYIDNCKFNAEKNDRGIKNLTYDITALSSTDSVSVTTTIYSDKKFKPDSVVLMGAKKCAVEKVYIEPKGKKWVSRLRFYITMKEFESIAATSVAPEMAWYVGSDTVAFSIKPKDWEKQRATWQTAIDALDL